MSKEEFSDQDWRRLIASFGEDPDRPGLLETPSRVSKAWKHWTSGYGQDPVELLKAFEDGAEQYNELIVVRGIHLCMESRGIRTPGEETITSAMLGELQPNLAMRTEFLALAREQ